MGQESKRFLKKSTGRGLRCKNEWLYKGIATTKMGHVIREGRKKRENTLYTDKLNQI